MPINWRNVADGGGFVAAARLTESAGDSFNKAFGNFGDMLDSTQKVVDDNFANERTNNNSAFRDYVSSFDSPEALQAAKESGEFARTVGGFGDNINPELKRDGFRDGLTDLRAQFSTDREYAEGEAQALAKPLFDQFTAMKLAGTDTTAFEAEHAEVLGAGGYLDDMGKLTQQQGDRKKRIAREDTEHKFKMSDAALARTATAKRLKKEEAEEAGERAISKSLTDMGNGRLMEAEASVTGLQELAVSMNLLVDDSGIPSSENTPAQLAEFQKQADKTGLMAQQNDTQRMQNAYHSWVTAAPRTAKEVTAWRTQATAMQAFRNQITPQEQGLRDQRQLAIDVKYDIARNPLAKLSTSPADDAFNIIESAKIADESHIRGIVDTEFKAQRLQSLVSSALADGVNIDGQLYKMSPGQVRGVVSTIREDYVFDDDPSTLFRSFLESPAYLKSLKAYDDHTAATLKETTANNTGSLKTALTRYTSGVNKASKLSKANQKASDAEKIEEYRRTQALLDAANLPSIEDPAATEPDIKVEDLDPNRHNTGKGARALGKFARETSAAVAHGLTAEGRAENLSKRAAARQKTITDHLGDGTGWKLKKHQLDEASRMEGLTPKQRSQIDSLILKFALR